MDKHTMGSSAFNLMSLSTCPPDKQTSGPFSRAWFRRNYTLESPGRRHSLKLCCHHGDLWFTHHLGESSFLRLQERPDKATW